MPPSYSTRAPLHSDPLRVRRIRGLPEQERRHSRLGPVAVGDAAEPALDLALHRRRARLLHWRAFYRLRADSLDDLLDAGWESPLDDIRTSPERVEERANRILKRLPARYQEVLTYRFLLNFSIRETAEKMRLTEANVKVLQFRALKKAGRIDLESL